MSAKTPLSIFTGQRSQIRLVSKSWGVARPSLVDAVDWTPNISTQTIMEFDNLTPALQFTTFDDVSGKISYPQNNQALVEAVLADWDPTQDEILVNPSNLQPFIAFANLKGLDGKIKGSYLLRSCLPTGNPWTSTVKEGAKRTLDFKALNAYLFHGLAIQYTRARGANTQQSAPAQPAVVSAGTGGFLGVDTYYVQLTAVTAAGETIASNEACVQVTAGAVNKLTVTIPAIVAPVTAYNVYASNRSNGERFVAQTTALSYDITALPSTTSATTPRTNTSGMPSVAGDKILTLGGGVYSATLDKAAFKLPQSGLDYALIFKNGAEIASVDNPASEDTFAFNAAGDTFSVLDTAAPDSWYDLFTLYKPS